MNKTKTEANWLKRENGETDKPLTEEEIEKLTKNHSKFNHIHYRTDNIKKITGFGKNKNEQYQKTYCQFYEWNGDLPSPIRIYIINSKERKNIILADLTI